MENGGKKTEQGKKIENRTMRKKKPNDKIKELQVVEWCTKISKESK